MSFIREYMQSEKYNVFQQRNNNRISNQYVHQVSAPMFHNFEKFRNPNLNKKQPNFLLIGLGVLFFILLNNKK